MRLDSKHGHKGYTTYHAERCAVLKGVVWVDDVEHCWAQYVHPYEFVYGALRVQVHQARRIMIFVDRRLIIINPVGLGEHWAQARGDVLVSHKMVAATVAR